MAQHGNGDLVKCANGCGALLGLNEGKVDSTSGKLVCEDDCKKK